MTAAAQVAIVRRLAEAATVDDAAHGVLAVVAAELGWDVAMLWVPDGDTGLRCGASWSETATGPAEFERVCKRLTLPPGVGLPGRVWNAAAPEYVTDLAGNSDFPRGGLAAGTGMHSAIAMPVLAAGAAVGVIELLSREIHPLDADHEALLRSAAGQLGHYVARARAEDRLRESEERTAAILEAALDCIVTMDHRGFVMSFNRAAEAAFRYTAEDAIGRPLAELIVPPALRDAHRAGIARYLATGEERILNRRLELEGMRADGTTFPVELTVARVGGGDPPLFAGFIRDITQRQEAEAERHSLVNEAQTERRRMEFLANAGLRMAASLDYTTVLEDVARAAVPHLADLCAVIVAEPDGQLRRVALVHADPALEQVAREMFERHSDDPESAIGMSGVLQSAAIELLPTIGDDHLQALARDEEHLAMLRRLAPQSSLTVPIRASGRTLGAIALVYGNSGRRFGDADLVVASSLAARAGLHIENARLYTERSRIAHTLQQSFLPAELPDIPGLEVAACYRAAGDQNEVGGDFYDVFPSGDGIWTAFIGDVSGKGAAAAALTALTRHTLYATALQEASPARNLALLNEAMLRRNRGASSFCTVIYLRVCPGDDGAVITLASGGHPPALVLRAAGGIEYIEAPGTLVGAFEDAQWTDYDVRLEAGDLLLLYTDGAVELQRDDLELGQRQLEGAVREHAGLPAEELVRTLAANIEALQDGSPRDDMALLALRVNGG